MKIVLVVILLLVAGGMLWVRLAPLPAGQWHADPLTATRSTPGGWIVRPEGGDATSPLMQAEPALVLAALDRVAQSTPRTSVLAGSVEEGRITYVTRSRLMGFPDLTTITVLAGADGGALPVLLARQRFGYEDMGVNRARVEDWLAQLDAAMAE